MKNFREWLSDYLRYFLLVLAAVLVFFLILIGYNLYKSTSEGVTGGEVVVVNDTEAVTEAESEYLPAPETESETEPESETETESEIESESETESETESESEEETQLSVRSVNAEIDEEYSDKPYGETSAETEEETSEESAAEESAEEENEESYEEDSYSIDAYSEDSYDEDSYIEVYEEEPEVYEPEYRTLTGTCNLREGPGYDYDVITEYPAGTTVEYLGMENGWVKVEVDGMIGYMGPSFFD